MRSERRYTGDSSTTLQSPTPCSVVWTGSRRGIRPESDSGFSFVYQSAPQSTTALGESMGTFPRRLHQHRRSSRRSLLLTTGVSASPPSSADDVVAHVEDIAREAWFRALRSECDHTGAEMQAASARCDIAGQNLAAALLGRDLEAIAEAYADLEARLISARTAARAYGQARETLDWELWAANRQAGDQFLDEYVGRRRMPGSPDESAFVPTARRTARALLTLGWLSRHSVSALVRLAAARRL